jgi:mono/diheme cytochrome c family protein
MDQQSPAPDTQIKRVVLNRMQRCGVCHHDYRQDDIQVLSRKPDMWMMVVECTECHARNFVAAVLNDGDADEAQLALRHLSDQATPRGTEAFDREATEPLPASASDHRERVSAGDVVDMHEFLREFDGDFTALFAKG